MAKLASLWVGETMSKIQELCLSSFVYHGHDLVLYTYEDRTDVPPGVVVKDGNDIMPYDNIGHPAHFADVFRYNMVNDTGMGWVDADILCLTKDWNFADDVYAIQEIPYIQNGIFRLPPNSDILSYIISESAKKDRSKIEWTEISSSLLEKAFDLFPEYKKYLIDYRLVNVIEYLEWEKLWNPNMLQEILRLSKNAHSLSVFNEMVDRSGIDKNNFPPGSALDYFYKKMIEKGSKK